MAAFVSLWFVSMLAGVAWMSIYAITPGTAAAAPAHLPISTAVPSMPGRDTLVMVVHPNCPCSRASISELTALAADCGQNVSIDVLFVPLEQSISDLTSGYLSSGDLTSGELWERASLIPGAHLLVDRNGQIARQLGASTSGQTMLYDAEGQLRFSGGITAARGHAGANVGRSAIAAIIGGGHPDTNNTPVFGCALY